MLSATIGAGSEFTIDHDTSAGILASDYIEQHGGSFRFQMTYISKTDGTESARSSILDVSVPPLQPRAEEQQQTEPTIIKYAKAGGVDLNISNDKEKEHTP